MSDSLPSGPAPAAAARAGTLTADAVPAPPPPHDAPVLDIGLAASAGLPPPPPPSPPATGTPATATATADGAPSRPASAPAWARSVPLFGPPGRGRSAAGVVGLTMLTLGWYAVSWHVRTNRQVADFDPHMQVRPTRSAWAVALPLATGWLAALAEAARVVATHLGHPPTFTLPPETVSLAVLAAPLAVPYAILLVPFALVAVVMTVERVRTVQQRVDVPDDHQLRPAASAALLLVPVVGGLLLVARVQGRLNEAWARVTH